MISFSLSNSKFFIQLFYLTDFVPRGSLKKLLISFITVIAWKNFSTVKLCSLRYVSDKIRVRQVGNFARTSKKYMALCT